MGKKSRGKIVKALMNEPLTRPHTAPKQMVHIPMPSPEFEPGALVLWLRLWTHLRGPHSPGTKKPFEVKATSADIEACRKHTDELFGEVPIGMEMEPTYAAYLRRGLAILGGTDKWVIGTAKAKADFGDWQTNPERQQRFARNLEMMEAGIVPVGFDEHEPSVIEDNFGDLADIIDQIARPARASRTRSTPCSKRRC